MEEPITANDLLKIVGALANPHRLRIVAALAGRRNYVSQLARDLNISRPLLHLHLQKLEGAGLVRGTLELSEDGKAMKYFEATPFSIRITPELIALVAENLTFDEPPPESTEAAQ